MSKLRDLTGQRFGDLVVIERVGSNERGEALWRCRCEHKKNDSTICGNFLTVRRSSLISGAVKTCGCRKYDYKDLTGRRFGDLVVLGRVGSTKKRQSLWRCRCDHVRPDGVICGSVKDYTLDHLVRVKTCGCGCRKYFFIKPTEAKSAYRVQYAMIARCENPQSERYKRYGGRKVGSPIRVCTEWHDKETFFRFLSERGWRPGIEIHRTDNDGDYCPENIELLTKDEHRQRHRAKYQFGVETVTRKVASQRLGLTVEEVKRLTCAGRIDQRIAKYLAANQGAMKDGGQPILPPSMSKPAA